MVHVAEQHVQIGRPLNHFEITQRKTADITAGIYAADALLSSDGLRMRRRRSLSGGRMLQATFSGTRRASRCSATDSRQEFLAVLMMAYARSTCTPWTRCCFCALDDYMA